MPEHELLTLKEFASVFKVAPATISRWVAAEVVPAEYVYRPSGRGKGRKLLIDERAIQALMNPLVDKRSGAKHYYCHNDTDAVRERLMKFF